MGKKVRKSKEKKMKEEQESKREAAKHIAQEIGLEVDWDSPCLHCLNGLSKVMLECGADKGLIFSRLHGIPESVFSNCNNELGGSATYKARHTK